MNQEKRLEILKALQADNPTPKTELEYHSNFELLIAVVLSAQATDKSVNEATRVLFPLANTPQAVLDLGPEKFTDIIKHIGLYRSKTKNVMKLCEDLIEHHNSQVPTDFDSLIKLPGVGQKTASVVMNVAFEKPGHARFSGSKPHRLRKRQNAGDRPEKNGAVHSAPLPRRCSSLVHSARALYLQSQKTRMLEVPD